MKTWIPGIALFAATVCAVALYPAPPTSAGVRPMSTPPQPPADVAAPTQPRVDVVFALDTTSSMSGFIEAAKEKIWSIASTMAAAQPAPQIRIGLVAYRDRGDAYITRVTDLSDDLDSVYARLMDFRAVGGGDGPESVNQALYDAVHNISWDKGADTYRVIFLVGDAPAHTDYPNDVQFPETLKTANQRGIHVNTIQSGQSPATALQWQQIAALSQGDFFNVGDDGGAVAVATPFDDELAALSRRLDETRLFFGSAADKARQEAKRLAADKVHALASAPSRARRAAFNVSEAGERNFLGEKELVEAVSSGAVSLDAVPEADLPVTLQAMSPEERATEVKQQATKREALLGRMRELAGRRDAYMEAEIAKEGGAEDSLDNKLFGVLRSQAAGKGMVYEAVPKY